MDFNIAQSYIEKLPTFEDLKIVPKIQELIAQYSEEIVSEYLKEIVNKRHKKIAGAKSIESIKNLDYSFDYYIEKLKENLIIEKGRPVKEILNCLGTIYSKYIGEKIYSEEIINDFKMVFTSYNNLEYNEEKGIDADIDIEINNLFSQIIKGKDFVLLNNLTSAIYLLIETIFKESNIIIGLPETIYLNEKIGINEIIKKLSSNVRIVGYLNKTDIKDYENAIDPNKENVIIYSEMFENNIDGIKRVDLSELENLKNTKVIYITNKAYYETDSMEIKNIGINFLDVVNNFSDLKILELSKLGSFPETGIITGDRDIISKVKENSLYKMFSPNRETKIIFYLTFKMYLEKKYNNIYINKCFSITNDELKKRNRKFVRNLEREIGEYVEIGFFNGNYMTLDDSMNKIYNFEREVIFIKPKTLDTAKIEKRLRNGSESILCWIMDKVLVFNLQLLSDASEEIIIENLSKIFLENKL
ncbi:MAG: hypothetical protein GX287_07830 [Fusobacteria bacterium]|nr:hypothetical protein [Fusobacteriota bacterium]